MSLGNPFVQYQENYEERRLRILAEIPADEDMFLALPWIPENIYEDLPQRSPSAPVRSAKVPGGIPGAPITAQSHDRDPRGRGMGSGKIEFREKDQ